MRRIDADRLIDEIDEAIQRAEQEGDAFIVTFFEGLKRVVNSQETAGPTKHDLTRAPEDLPVNEQWVLMRIRCSDSDYVQLIGFYENGEQIAEESEYDWSEVIRYLPYDPARQAHLVPKGWYEWTMYAGDCTVGAVGDPVEAWFDLGGLDE